MEQSYDQATMEEKLVQTCKLMRQEHVGCTRTGYRCCSGLHNNRGCTIATSPGCPGIRRGVKALTGLAALGPCPPAAILEHPYDHIKSLSDVLLVVPSESGLHTMAVLNVGQL